MATRQIKAAGPGNIPAETLKISHQTGPSITFPDRISAENDAEQLHNACKLLCKYT
ncbi:unnamed protein product [Schistosoma margrebowiei]|uniref:Uncharacterized protein n=1 Tax=Schistosoma margrebowiei TaxID=48269 RepID=A0A183LN71_9TREM|nr:unnamed protein product [Schistosoma margrebowiei]